ncbi:hypothetical protein DPMN_194867 [Dreissena polymorpha]|uniref:Uncharacterized protein n=1 Tax=Dreissena polymorpha TaxID=45954 RepID=A0A9D3XXH5_DREPO|nr:hypothetical protein DPMN_194867 [Dreissena polymorpha]
MDSKTDGRTDRKSHIYKDHLRNPRRKLHLSGMMTTNQTQDKRVHQPLLKNIPTSDHDRARFELKQNGDKLWQIIGRTGSNNSAQNRSRRYYPGDIVGDCTAGHASVRLLGNNVFWNQMFPSGSELQFDL